MGVNIKATTTTTTNMVKVKCHKCKYEWDTDSKLMWVTCPSCRTKTLKERKEK